MTILALANPKTLPLNDNELRVVAWLEHAIADSARNGSDEAEVYLAMLAFNSLTGSWAEASDDGSMAVIHVGNDWCKAPLGWFGNGLVDSIRIHDGLPVVDDVLMRKAFGQFSLRFFEKFRDCILRDLVNNLRQAANTNCDIELLVRLQVFTPFLPVLIGENIDEYFVNEILDQTCKLANSVQALPYPSHKWEAEIQLGWMILLSGAASLIFLERQLDPDFG